jgi:hypothetical protein
LETFYLAARKLSGIRNGIARGVFGMKPIFDPQFLSLIRDLLKYVLRDKGFDFPIIEIDEIISPSHDLGMTVEWVKEDK